MNDQEIARAGAEASEAKKASDVLMLDVTQCSPICDYVVLASGTTRLQIRAIANAIDESLKSIKAPRRRQGFRAGGWILLDYGTVVFHVFLVEEREYYNLEGLLSAAPVLYRGKEGTPH